MKGLLPIFPSVCVVLAGLLVMGTSSLEAKGSADGKKSTRKASEPAGFNTVVVDAGHGGFDPGGIPQNIIHEKGVALDVAMRLRNHLEASGIRVVMTRSEDVFVTLGERVRIANAERDAIFVSIHFNSALRREARGVEGYYGSPAGAPLAEMIHQRLLPITVNPDYRPVKHATFWVLKETKIPAVLVECGFLTNPDDAAAASSEEFREKLATEIAAAIVDHRRWLGGPVSGGAVGERSQKGNGSKLQAMEQATTAASPSLR